MLDLMERNQVRAGRGAPIGSDGVWLDGNTTAYEARDILPDTSVSRASAPMESLFHLGK
jgi:hypothetical protein